MLNFNFLSSTVWLLSLQESAEEEVKEVSEAFRSNRASAGASESDDNEKNTEEKVDDQDDEADVTIKTNADNSKNERVRLVSMSKAGPGKDPISDKDRMKAGMMTTNKKVWWRSQEFWVKVCVDFWPITSPHSSFSSLDFKYTSFYFSKNRSQHIRGYYFLWNKTVGVFVINDQIKAGAEL